MSLRQHSAPTFDVGICTTGDSPSVIPLLRGVRAEAGSSSITLGRIIVAASACPPDIVSQLSAYAAEEPRLRLILEEVRRGKAAAINSILSRSEAEFIVLLNSDAHPAPGSIGKLVDALAGDTTVGVVSARPVPLKGRGAVSMLNDFMWTAHNTCSLALNHMNIANHSSDELFALRRLSITPLPEGLVNDGAFLAGHARNLGYKVKFSEEAFVGVETPSRGIDVIGQRRRILFGHAEVWRKTGRIPRTIESLMIFSPWIGFKLLFRTLVESPQYLLILPVAAVSELVAVALSVWDVASSSRRHSVWRRYT